MADTLSAQADSLGCSKLSQIVFLSYKAAQTRHHGSAFANALPNFSNLVAALRACLSPQQEGFEREGTGW